MKFGNNFLVKVGVSLNLQDVNYPTNAGRNLDFTAYKCLYYVDVLSYVIYRNVRKWFSYLIESSINKRKFGLELPKRFILKQKSK